MAKIKSFGTSSFLALFFSLNFSGILAQQQLLEPTEIIQPAPMTPNLAEPNLSGQHFRITVVEQDGYVDMKEEADGTLSYSGYLLDILRELSREDRGNFTYTLLTASGYGSGCSPRLEFDGNSTEDHPDVFHPRYRSQYQCAEADVNDRPLSSYSTDFYWGVFYITPGRLQVNTFTVPYTPPMDGTLGLIGTATHIHGLEDLLTNHYATKAICAFSGTAYLDTLRQSFPHVEIVGLGYGNDVMHEAFDNGMCDVWIGASAELGLNIKRFVQEGKCLANGMPIGVIGDPLQYGLKHFSFGIRSDLPFAVQQTLDFWLQALMACFPQDSDGYCPEDNGGGSLSQLFGDLGGKGDECGYVQFPVEKSSGTTLSTGVIVAMVVTPVVFVLVLAMLYHMRQIKIQERRMKKRFIQQLARNIEIGESARAISADKLSEAFTHIGGAGGLISKKDLAKWMTDLHMDFMSEKDFDKLWDAMDMDGKGVVDPIDFFHFLDECKSQFKEVHEEFSALPKTEKIKISARRLSNLSELGEDGVADLERRNNRRSRCDVSVTRSSATRNSGEQNNTTSTSSTIPEDQAVEDPLIASLGYE